MRVASVFLLFAGMVFYFINPASEKVRHDAFTSWLQSQLKNQENPDVIDRIHKLSQQEDELESVIRKASELVHDHSDDFEIPLNHQSRDEQEVFHLLLSEWNQFRNSNNGMGKAVVIDNIKPRTVLPVDGLTFLNKSADQQYYATLFSRADFCYSDNPALNYHISPLSGGTAIGAP